MSIWLMRFRLWRKWRPSILSLAMHTKDRVTLVKISPKQLYPPERFGVHIGSQRILKTVNCDGRSPTTFLGE